MIDFPFVMLALWINVCDQLQTDMMEQRGRTSPGGKSGRPSSPALLVSRSSQGTQIRVLTLNHGEHLDSSIFRFRPHLVNLLHNNAAREEATIPKIFDKSSFSSEWTATSGDEECKSIEKKKKNHVFLIL